MALRRVWVPGVVWVETKEPWQDESTPSRLHVDPLAGWWFAAEDITNWKDIYFFARREELARLDQIPDGYYEWPSALLDEMPRLRELWEKTPLVRIDGVCYVELRKDPVTLYTVGFARNADDYFHVIVERGGEPIASLGSSGTSLMSAVYGAGQDGEDDEDNDRGAIDEAGIHDRILRALTDEVVSERSIGLAFWWYDVASIKDRPARQAAVAAMEAALTQVFERNNEAAIDEARRIASSIGETETADVEELVVPLYGTIRRRLVPACSLRSLEDSNDLAFNVRIARDGETSHTLELPEERHWLIDAPVDDWLPAAWADVGEAMRAAYVPRPKSRWRAIRDLVALLAAVILIAILISRAC